MIPITDSLPPEPDQQDQATKDEAEPQNPDLPISEDLQGCLKDLLRICENEDQTAYWALVQKWTRLEYYFNNIITIFWDANYAGGAGGWRAPDWNDLEDEGTLPPRIIGIYRAHAEAIIAALSVSTPSIVFFPDDADDPLDIETANTYSDISALIQKHIKSPLIFMRILTVLFNQGTVFAYNYYKTDPKFGIKHKPHIEAVPFIEDYTNTCPVCGYQYGNSFEPVTVPLPCEQCGQVAVPEATPNQSSMNVQTGVDKFDKGRVCIDIFDPRSVKVSIYAKEQSHIGYLLLVFNQNVAMVRSEFKDESITVRQGIDTLQWARNSTNYLGQFPDNVANVKCLWVRPWQFHALGDGKADQINEFLALYPKGCYAIFINDEIKYVTDEDMDAHWTISSNPLASFIHGEPLGTNLATIQDIQAEVDELVLQTLEHGISETFVKPETLDLDTYKQSMARPGQVTPVKSANPGEALGNSFFETRVAAMNSDLANMNVELKTKAEFTTGSFPSIYGGAGEGGGTAYEYKKSNASALQRVGIVWKIATEFWCELQTKAADEFVEMMDGDERYTERNGAGFQNVNIQQSSLLGKISRSEPEYSDQLPVTWEQMNSTLTKLMELNSPEISQVLFDPNNAELMKKAMGLQKLYIPGEDSRTKQLAEYLLLSQQPPMGMQSSIPPGPTDVHEVEAEILQGILNSSRGQKLKMAFPEGFQNCVLHWQEHMALIPPPPEAPTDQKGKVPPQKGKVNNAQ